MSFYSNNMGKVTGKLGLNTTTQGFKQTKGGGPLGETMAIKENLSPDQDHNPEMITPNYYDPFGDKDYKIKYFQNSASQFMSRRPARLDLESQSNEGGNQGGIMANEEMEESKNGIRMLQNHQSNLGMINRSDAFHTDGNRQGRRPPLQQIRLNMIKQANMNPSSSDGFSKQKSLPKNQRSIQFDEGGNYNDIYDLHPNTL